MKYSILGLSLMSALTAVAIASTGAIKNVDDEVKINKVTLSGNGSGDEIATNNVTLK